MSQRSDVELIGQGTLPGVKVPLQLDATAVQLVLDALTLAVQRRRGEAALARQENWAQPRAQEDAVRRALRLDLDADVYEGVLLDIGQQARRWGGA